MKEKLPIRLIFKRSLEISIWKKAKLIRVAWPYAVLTLIFTMFAAEISGGIEITFYYITTTLTGVIALVACHRVFLLELEQTENLEAIRWSITETNFLFALVALTMALVLPYMVSIIVVLNIPFFEKVMTETEGSFSSLLFNVLLLPAYYLSARFSLILPAIALDREYSFSQAWKLSLGNGMRLAALVMILPTTVYLSVNGIWALFGENLAIDFLFAVIYLVVGAIEICLLSLSYLWLTENQSGEP